MRVLIVEGDADVAWSAAELVRSMGHEPKVAHDAASAARLADGADAVLLDRHVAGAGLAPLLARLGRRTPVVLLTSNPAASDVAASPPFVAVLEKPFRLAELEAALDAAAGGRPRVGDPAGELASG